MYKEKLIALLRSLEVNNIDKLIEKPTAYLVTMGILIAAAAKRGANTPPNKAIQADPKPQTSFAEDVSRVMDS
jgi:hypothetical protein